MQAFVEEAAVGARLCVLKTRVPGETRWIILGKGRGAEGVGILSHDAKKARFAGRMPKGHTRIATLSSSLEGGTLTRLGPRSLTVVKGDDTFTVRLRGANVSVKKEAPGDDELSLDDASNRGEALLDAILEGAVDAFRVDVDRALAKAQARVARRVEAIGKDLAAMASAEDVLVSAQWLLPEAQRAKRGQKELVATDWSADPPREIKVALDPARSAKEQIEAMFKRARRLKAGRAFAEPRLAATQAIAKELGSLRDAARAAANLAALDEIAARAKSTAPKDFALATTSESLQRDEAPHEHRYRVYRGAGGARIFVGRTAKENDALTFKVARPHDVWLHAKGRRGAHVVVPRDRGEDMPADLLVDAAHLAAHFSEARDEAVVDVEYTHRKFVGKPKGGAPGLAIVEREKVIAVRIEKARLAGLLGEGE